VRAGVVLEPLIDSEPLQPPDAVHEVALVDDHVNVDVAPLATLIGLALRETVGADPVCVVEVEVIAEVFGPEPAQPERRATPKVML
jgi:hypothetical protein